MRVLRITLIASLMYLLYAAGSITSVYASDGRNFNAGRIIDDAVFTNSNSMTVQEIQNFLNSKMPQCDTWGTKPSEYGGGTRAQYAASKGVNTPFTCLKDYYQNPSTGEDNYGRATPAESISAAQIIYNYATQFRINPQTILVTLQKENGMVTDEWPFPKQYREAMGFGCPDNVAPGAPACNPSYGSFSAQIYEAARHFRGYIDNPDGWYVPYTTGNNSILWSPDTNCGTSTVNIENRSTVALYSYTPYRPNQAALNAQYGTGDGCSAYGNRNFYLYFTDWFGSVYGDVQVITPVTLLSSSEHGLFTNFVETSFVLKNNSAQWRDVGTVATVVRDSAGRNYDFGAQNITLAPYQEYLYRSARSFDKEDTYSFWITSYREGIGWVDDYPSSINGYQRRYNNKIVQNLPTIAQDPAADSELRFGKTSNITFRAVNNSKYPVNLGYIGAALRSPSGKNVDLQFENVPSLSPMATYSYSKQFTPLEVGDYSSFITSTPNGGLKWYEASYPIPAVGNDGRAILSAKPSPTLTQGPTLSVASPRAGQNTSASFKIRNFGSTVVNAGYVGIAVRDPEGKNADVGGVDLSSLAADSEYTFSGSRVFTKPGTYTAWVVSYKNGAWTDDYPGNENSQIQRKITFTVLPSPTLTQGISFNANPIAAGIPLQANFTIHNYGSTTVTIDGIALIIRKDFRNYDMPLSGVSIAPGQDYVYSASKSFTGAGTYSAWISSYNNGAWNDLDYPASDNPGIVRKTTFTVQ